MPIDCVWRMGESYFCHAGITPQRIFPFAVATRGQGSKIMSGPVQFAPMRFIYQVFNNFMWKNDTWTMPVDEPVPPAASARWTATWV